MEEKGNAVLELTRNDLDEIGGAIPDVCSVVNDDYHVGVAWEEALEGLASHTCETKERQECDERITRG